MRSLGRETEFDRINARIDALKTRRVSKVHLAVVAPRHGGLSLFLDDLADRRRAQDDLVASATVTNSLEIEAALADVVASLATAIGEPSGGGSVESIIRLGRTLRAKHPERIAVVILDVAAAVRGIAEDAQMRQSAKSNELLQKLRTIVNVLQNHEPPIAFVMGWDDRFREYARDWQVGDVVQRYTAETLFADFGIGRRAWPLFRQVFESNGLGVAADYPGICGSGLPAGAFAHAAKSRAAEVVDGMVLRDTLLGLVSEQDRRHIETVDWSLVERLCLRDEELTSDPGLNSLVHLNAAGKYVASRELYSLLHLAPPHEIVSFQERVRLRLEDRDPGLASEVGTGIATILGSAVVASAAGGLLVQLKADLVPQPFKRLEVLQFVSFASVPEPWLVESAASWIAEGERDPVVGIRRLLLLLHDDPALKNTFGRKVVEELGGMGIVNPRPCDAKETSTVARPLAGLLCTRLEPSQIVNAVWPTHDSAHEDELLEFLGREIQGHYKTLVRSMGRLAPDSFPRDEIQALINASGASVEISGSAADRIRRLRLATSGIAGRFEWRWRDDAFLQWLSALDTADAAAASRRFLIEPEDWPAIASSIYAAYGDALVRLEQDVVSAVDPRPLLESQYTEARRQLLEVFKALARVVTSEGLNHWKARLANFPATPPPMDRLQDSIVTIWEMNVSIGEACATAASENDARIAALTELRLSLEQTNAPNADLDEERAECLRLLTSPPQSPAEATAVFDRAAQVLRQIGDAVVKQQARERRVSPFRQELEQLTSQSPLLKERVDDVRAQINDPLVPAEQIALEVERLKASADVAANARPSSSSQEGPEKSDTFFNSAEDLARLASLYRRGRITRVEIK